MLMFCVYFTQMNMKMDIRRRTSVNLMPVLNGAKKLSQAIVVINNTLVVTIPTVTRAP